MSENIICELLEGGVVTSLFKERLGLDVEVLDITPIKKNIWQTTYHIVFCYHLLLKGESKQVFVTAHDHEPREVALKSLQYLYQNGFGSGNFLVPEPLFFEPKYNATFYIGLEGNNLYHYIRNDDRAEIRDLIIKTAQWFSMLHGLDIHNNLIFRENNARISIVSPGVNAVLSTINANYPEFIHYYDEFYRFFIEQEDSNFARIKRSMIHGDAHPENIIRLSAEKIGVIDFVDMSVGDRARDLGTFLQQLDYMTGRKIGDPEFTAEIKELFLTSYLKSAKMEMDKDLEARIDLYYNWTAIRTATYFLMKHNPEPARAEPLIEIVKHNLKIK
jgi:hypothetical protein